MLYTRSHEKAGQVKIRSGRFSKTADADQWEARRFPHLFPNYAISESPAPIRTDRGAVALLLAGVLNSMGLPTLTTSYTYT